jgi:hypothetical protein
MSTGLGSSNPSTIIVSGIDVSKISYRTRYLGINMMCLGERPKLTSIQIDYYTR